MKKVSKTRNCLKIIFCAVLSLAMLIEPLSPVAGASRYIGKAKAKTIALKDAGVKKSKAKSMKVKLEKEDGVKCYDVEFKTSSKKYEYEIKATNGKILEKSVKKIKKKSGKKTISKEKAKKIALKDAGLTSSQVTFTKAKPDTDDGVKVYEVEFHKGTTEYEYEINAKTGKILDKDVDYD